MLLLLLQFFVEKCNQELAEKLAAHRADLQGLKTRDRIRTAVKWRLEMLIPYMGHFLPHSNCRQKHSVQKSRCSDELWRAVS